MSISMPDGISNGNYLAVQPWIEATFAPGSRPTVQTVIRWIRAGDIPGRKIGHRWYVAPGKLPRDGDELARQVLKELGIGQAA